MNKFIEGLKIMAPHYQHGLDEEYFMDAEHDIVYFHVTEEQIPRDSDDGKRLDELGFHIDSENEVWAIYV